MNEDVEREAEGIIAEIHRAFADVSREDGVTLQEALVIDEYGSAEERLAARERDTDRRWEDVPEHMIGEHDSVLCFMDPKGFRYYLPAYMVWSLRNYETSETWSHNHPICSLALSDSDSPRKWEIERFVLFDEEQARAIYRFLHFMAQRDELSVCVDEARKALDAYWCEFSE